MKRLGAVLSLAAALLASTLAGTAMGQDYNSQRGYGSARNPGSQRDGWARNRDRSARADLQGRWVAEGRGADVRSDRQGFRGAGGMRAMMLPEVISIDQRPSLVRISDSQNRMLQEILIDRRFDSRNGGQAGFDPRDRGRSDRHDYLSGRWSGSTLMVESTGLRGGSITQTFALQDRGRSLVVRTRRDGSNSGRTVEFTKVYRRA